MSIIRNEKLPSTISSLQISPDVVQPINFIPAALKRGIACLNGKPGSQNAIATVGVGDSDFEAASLEVSSASEVTE